MKFTVTLHYDEYPNLEPQWVRQFERYGEAYEYARAIAKSQAIWPSQYTKVVFDETTWLDSVEAYQCSYNALERDKLLAHAVITCDDLPAWHAAQEAGQGRFS